jgi:hypothetical protein
MFSDKAKKKKKDDEEEGKRDKKRKREPSVEGKSKQKGPPKVTRGGHRVTKKANANANKSAMITRIMLKYFENVKTEDLAKLKLFEVKLTKALRTT